MRRLMIAFVMLNSFSAFANTYDLRSKASNEPIEYGEIVYAPNDDSSICSMKAPRPATRQSGETWCSYNRRFSKYLEHHLAYERGHAI